MKKMILIVILIISVYKSYSQSKTSTITYPEIGKPCPDFVLKDVINYPKKEVRLNDFKGKWLILDFWDRDCTACIESFPKINALQKEFGDKVQFILVGDQDKGIQISSLFVL